MQSKPIETLRLSDRDKAKLREMLEAEGTGGKQSERRQMRVAYHAEGILVTVMPKHGSATRLRVVPRNLSQQGMAFIHGRFVYPETPVRVMMPTLDGEKVGIDGEIRRCRHVTGIVHVVSIVFREAIDLSMFVELDEDQARAYRQERSQAEGDDAGLAGRRVLVVDDCRSDQQLFRYHLEQAGLRVDVCGTIDEARAKALSITHDFCLVDVQLGEDSGLELVRSMRERGYDSPCMVLTADGSDETQALAFDAGANAFLAKPVVPAKLLRAVRELLGEAVPDQEPIHSMMKGDPGFEPLIMGFLDDMKDRLTRWQAALDAEDFAGLLPLAHQIKGSAGGYGYPEISAKAQAYLDLEGGDGSAELGWVLADMMNRLAL